MFLALRGELALERGRVDQAIAQLESAFPRLQTQSGPRYRAALALAEAWLCKGNIEKAIAILQTVVYDDVMEAPTADAGFDSLIARLKLAALFRRQERRADADSLNRQAMRGLDMADARFVERLHAIVGRNPRSSK